MQLTLIFIVTYSTKMNRKILFLLLALFGTTILAQKKVLDHADYKIWSTVQDATISPDGSHVIYSIERGEKDNFLKIQDSNGNFILEYDRADKGQFTYNSKYAIFNINAWKDSVIAMKKRKVKKKNLPKDSLAIFNLKTQSLSKIGNIKSYKVPKKWSGFVAYQLEDIKKEKTLEEKDSTKTKEKKKEKLKKVGKDNGYHLVLRNLENNSQDTIKFVKDYIFAEKGKYLAYSSTGETKKDSSGVFIMNLVSNSKIVLHKATKAKYFKMNFSESGKNLGFVVDTDTSKIQLRPNELYLWKEGQKTAMKIADNATTPSGYVVSKYGEVHFSKDESTLFFGLSKPPIEKDTSLLAEEIVNVEVWTYNEPKLYTVQELQLKNDSIQSFTSAYHLKNNKIVQLASSAFMNTELGDEGNGKFALVNTSMPYELPSQWTGRRAYDYKVINTETGETHLELKQIPRMRLSPKTNYGYGYNRADSTWFAYNLNTKSYASLTKGSIFYDERNDSPNFPRAYGLAGWTKDDKEIVIYDRYDIWKFNPDTKKSVRLTNGRATKTVYRYEELDKEKHYLNINEKWILRTFNETTKNAGYAEFNPKNNSIKQLIEGPYRYSNFQKSKLSNTVIYSKESFETFPDIRLTDLNFKKDIKLSEANPQQSSYNWGTIELVNWTSLDGKVLSGMLVKPEDFDPTKKYPLLVNFYERSSDGIHRHRYPKPERSTINYSFFTSRGYVIFNPDVEYRIGYPGESAYNCVIPGVTSLIEKGFIDKDNIGVQGHSWGGYQIAYLVTKTDIFKAAESGAPVPNMISAYGGIRWWTGLSRQFQYEHTQSRIGGTPWEYPARYIENSPIFNIDKINTPLLIMHNDADGHVPWYQGIEFFVSLRRLGKPSWFLNYNGEPHWPLKYQNRTDFSIRMAQFFDHYLKGKPKPMWMERGVPPIEKGIKQGYQLIEK